MDISYDYIKKRRDFGKRPNFEDTEAYVLESVVPVTEDGEQWMQREQTTMAFDCIPQMAEHEVNTERFVQGDENMLHSEGGWPKEVKSSEFKERERHLRRIETEDTYAPGIKSLVGLAERCVLQNNAIDVYQEYFADAKIDHSSEPPSAKTLTVLRDPNGVRRAATNISWNPDGNSKLAVSYSIMDFQKMPTNMPLSSYTWDLQNPNEPDFEIIPPSPLCSLVYNPKNAEHLVGGCYNGLIAFWDIRKGSKPVEKSIVEKSHHDPVYDIQWVQSRSGNECCSVSTDGQILWWDIRKLGSGPTDSMILESTETHQTYGATSLEYRADAGATRFLIGTEEGIVLNVERKAKKDFDSQKSIRMFYGLESSMHHGPVYSISRNPTNLKFFLTIGDWCAKVWMEDIKTPIMTTPYERSYLTSGCWSPTRPGVFFTTKLNGTLDVWDLFYKQNDPVYTSKVGEVGLCSIRVHKDGQIVAVGSVDGNATLLEVCPSLSEPQTNEKASVTQMFERENKREKNLEVRAMQLKKKVPIQSDATKTGTLKIEPSKEELLQVEKSFFEAISNTTREGVQPEVPGAT